MKRLTLVELDLHFILVKVGLKQQHLVAWLEKGSKSGVHAPIGACCYDDLRLKVQWLACLPDLRSLTWRRLHIFALWFPELVSDVVCHCLAESRSSLWVAIVMHIGSLLS